MGRAKSKKISQEEFIKQASEIHDNRYTYEQIEYINKSTKIDITCEEHGIFSQRPYCHLQGDGCPYCGSCGKITQSIFVVRATEIHGDLYDYSKAVPSGAHNKVTIFCKKHGDFEQTPAAHLRLRQGCPTCYQDRLIERTNEISRKSGETFAERATKVHDARYDYSKVEYKRSSIPVEIICNKHGSFWQIPNNHLKGRGCNLCMRYGATPTRSNYLYLMTTSDNYFKVGITGRKPRMRLEDVRSDSGLDFMLAKYWYFENGPDAFNLETLLLNLFLDKYERIPEKFNGYTECFIGDSLDIILHEAEQEVNAFVQLQDV